MGGGGGRLGHDCCGHCGDAGGRYALGLDPPIAGLSFTLAAAQYGGVGGKSANPKGSAMGIQLYGFWRSIASFRVRVALKLKGLPFAEIPIHILSGEQFTPGYHAAN